MNKRIRKGRFIVKTIPLPQQIKETDNQILQLLPQIMSTILSIVFGLFAGYWLFLNSSIQNIDSKIEEVGFEICNCFLSDSLFRENPFWTGETLREKYQDKFPKMTETELLVQISSDLINLSFTLQDTEKNWNLDSKDRLSAFTDDGLPIYGRIYFYLMHRFFESYKGDQELDSFPLLDGMEKQKQNTLKFFPKGPYGVDIWQEHFQQIQNAYSWLFEFRKNFDDDFSKYLVQYEKKYKAPPYSRFNHHKWMYEANLVFIEIEKKAARLNSLLRAKSLYALDCLFPHRILILYGLIISAIFGIIAPLLILATKTPVHKGTNLILNLTLIFFTLGPLCAAILFFYKDINKSQDRNLSAYLLESLHNDICEIIEKIDVKVCFDNGGINFALSKSGLFSSEFKNELEKLRDTTIAYNQLSKTILREVIKNINNEPILKLYFTNSEKNMREYSMIYFFEELPNINIPKNTSLYLKADFPLHHNYPVRIKIPDNDSIMISMNNALRGVFSKIKSSQEFSDFSSKRTQLTNQAKMLLTILKHEEDYPIKSQ